MRRSPKIISLLGPQEEVLRCEEGALLSGVLKEPSHRGKKTVVYSLILFYNESMRKPSFEQFEATSLYCSKCKAAVPVRKRLLLVLPEGEEYEYLCAYCSSSVGTKIDKNVSQIEVLVKP
jgi:hypothetical protein